MIEDELIERMVHDKLKSLRESPEAERIFTSLCGAWKDLDDAREAFMPLIICLLSFGMEEDGVTAIIGNVVLASQDEVDTEFDE